MTMHTTITGQAPAGFSIEGPTFGVPLSLAGHAEAAAIAARRVRTALTGFSTRQALAHAVDDARNAQRELDATLDEMEALLALGRRASEEALS